MNEEIKNEGSGHSSETLGKLAAKFSADRDKATAEVDAREEYWKHEANHDELTGLLNRKGFMREAKDILEHHPNPSNLALVVLDLDRLKRTNDKHGHNVGDAAIEATGIFLKKHLRLNDLIARNITGRVGGDEYYAILDLTPREDDPSSGSVSNEQKLMDIRDRLQKDFIKEVVEENPKLIESGFGISGGGVLYTPGTSMEDWIKHADALMYEQKQARGNARS
jgi:diguanylate cyclase (GGDEF)-like protein